jgi:hypothetical protein
MGFGKLFFGESISARRHYPKWFETYGFTLLGWSYGDKKCLFCHGTFSVKNGARIRFWEDAWLDNAPLSEQYLALYRIVRRQGDTIATVMATSPPNTTFRRVLLGQRLVAWNTLIHWLEDIQLSPELDKFRWNLHVDGIFSVKSLYNAILISDLPVDNNKKI